MDHVLLHSLDRCGRRTSQHLGNAECHAVADVNVHRGIHGGLLQLPFPAARSLFPEEEGLFLLFLLANDKRPSVNHVIGSARVLQSRDSGKN